MLLLMNLSMIIAWKTFNVSKQTPLRISSTETELYDENKAYPLKLKTNCESVQMYCPGMHK